MDYQQPKTVDPAVAAAWIAHRTGLDATRIEGVINAETDYLVAWQAGELHADDGYIVIERQNDGIAQRTREPLGFVQVVMAEMMEYMVEIGLAQPPTAWR